MTREEQLDWLYRLRSEIYVYMPKEWLIPMNNALDMAIKALEQGSALDKIRAEINNLTVFHATKDKQINLISQNAVNRIFDKYKAESEVKE